MKKELIKEIKMKTQLLSIIAIFISITTLAQASGSDVITLKDGTKYQGAVVEQKPGKYIKLLQIPSGDTVLIQLKEIDKLVKIYEEPKEEEPTITESKLDLTQLKMFNVNDYHVHLSYQLGAGDFALAGFGLKITKTINDKIQTGIGVDYIGNYGSVSSFKYSVPISACIKYELQEHRTGRTATILNLDAGYNYMMKNTYHDHHISGSAYFNDGIYLNPSLGYRLNFTQEMGIELAIGYQFSNGRGIEKETDSFIRNHNWQHFKASASLFF